MRQTLGNIPIETPLMNSSRACVSARSSAGPIGLPLFGAFLSGVLVVLAFPLFGSELGLEGLSFAALVPFFLAARGCGAKRGFLLGAVTGATLEIAGFIWILHAIREFTALPAFVAALFFAIWAAYSSLPWALLGLVVGKSDRASPLGGALLFWVGMEHLYPRLFPWHLGGALHEVQWLAQSVDVWGTSGLTLLVVLANIVIARGIRWRMGLEAPPFRTAGLFFALLVASLLYGALRLESVRSFEASREVVRVALVQGVLDPKEKREDAALEYYLVATRRLLETSPADLVVWPEGGDSRPFDLSESRNPWRLHGAFEPGGRAFDLEHAFSVPLVAGAWGLKAGRVPVASNIAAYVVPGRPPLFYEKNVRVPFGEVVPLLDWVPEAWRRAMGISVGTISAGRGNPVFTLGSHTFRNLICYEAILPEYVRRTASGVDFLVNITEDIWYGRTAHVPQHVSVLRLRALENRTPIVRVTNLGPSGVLGITGEFRTLGRVFAPAAGVVELRAGSLPTLYAVAGRFLPLAALGLFVLTLWRWGRRDKDL